MEHLSVSLPEQKDYSYSYGLAFKLACEQLAKISDVDDLCRKSGCSYRVEGDKKIVKLVYLNQTYEVTLPDMELKKLPGKEEVQLRDKILIAHYLVNAMGTPLSNKPITYKEIKDGATYFPTFYKRAIKPVVDCFGKCPEKLPEAAKALGGQQASYGDVSVTINAFSRVPVTFVLFKGDDEFPPEGSILLDATISDYLTTEDITILCQTIAWMLVKGVKA